MNEIVTEPDAIIFICRLIVAADKIIAVAVLVVQCGVMDLLLYTVNPLYLAFLCPKCISVLLIWRLAFPYNVTRYVQRILASL